MTVEILLWTWSGFFWGILSLAAFVLGLLLIALILFQDSKDTGLTSAFGGGGSSALMGARMQKDLAKLTAIFAIALAVCLVLMGRITRFQTEESFGNVTSGGAPPAMTTPIPGGPGGGSSTPGDSSPSGATPGLPLDPLAPPIVPPPAGDGAGFPGLGSIPPGSITAPGDAAKSAPQEAPKAPETPAGAPEPPAGTSPAPALPEKAPAPPEGNAGGTPPPASR